MNKTGRDGNNKWFELAYFLVVRSTAIGVSLQLTGRYLRERKVVVAITIVSSTTTIFLINKNTFQGVMIQ